MVSLSTYVPRCWYYTTARAIYVANKYPEAEVIAADMNPLPAR